MQTHANKMLAALAFVALSAGPAHAEPRWSHPQGLYSFDQAGWTLIPNSASGENVASFQPAGWRNGQPIRICTIRQVAPTAAPGATQAFINTRMMTFSPASQSAAETVSNLTHAMVGGVAVASFNVTGADRASVWRMFALVTAEGVVQHQISCGGETPLSEADLATLNAFVNSLQFDNLAAAGAPAAARWTSALGGWSIDFASTGWTFANAIPENMRNVTLIMLPGAGEQDRVCIVTEETYTDNGSRAAIRGYARRFDRQRANNIMNARNQDLDEITHSERGGMAIAEMRGTSNNGANLHRHMVFYTPASDRRASFIDVDCRWPRTATPEQVAQIDAILASIQFATD